MPRSRRISPDGFVQHVVNRGDHRDAIFHKPSDFRAFLAVIAEAAYRIPVRILAYCIMRNHFHLVLWPYEGKDLPAFMQLVMNIHINRYLRHYPPSSPGHIYQGRYANPLVETGPALLRVIRYVEANGFSAGLVKRAEHYKWSSASPRAADAGRPTLAEWPIAKPADWSQYLNTPTPADEWKKLQRSIRRGAPYGSDPWVTSVAAAHGLKSTLRPRGRPRSYETFVPTT
jgi:putative transposase